MPRPYHYPLSVGGGNSSMDVAVERQTGQVRVTLSKAIYEKEAVFAAAYALTDWCQNRIEPGPEGTVMVTLKLLPEQQHREVQEVESRFMNELIDQQLRLELERRYGALRELIVRHAFSPIENLEAEVIKIAGRK